MIGVWPLIFSIEFGNSLFLKKSLRHAGSGLFAVKPKSNSLILAAPGILSLRLKSLEKLDANAAYLGK